MLNHVLEVLDLDPGVMLRYLDQNEHLNSPPRMRKLDQRGLYSGGWTTTTPTELRVAIDQANHVTAVVIPEERSGFSGNAIWTVVMFAAEDDCLGIDFNPIAPSISQVVRSSTETIAATFESSLRALTEDQRQDILTNPSILVWLYMGPFIEAVACHIALLRREWSILYEPHANTSAAYGGAAHRDMVRKLAREYSKHLRYLNTSLDNLKRLVPPKLDTNNNNPSSPWRRPSSVANLESLIADLEHFAQDLETLKATSDQFLEQQVSKISLQEARMSMREARDLKRLSYLGFIFVPLSLASSFFSIQIEPLSEPAPLWVFIVTSLAILAFSIGVMVLTNSTKVKSRWEGLKKTVSGLAQRVGWEQESESSPPDDNTGERDTRPRPATGKSARGKIPMNDHARRKAMEKLMEETPGIPNPFYRTEYEDLPSGSFDTPSSHTGVSASPFPSPAQHKPTRRGPKYSTAPGGTAGEIIDSSTETNPSDAEKQILKVATPPMPPLPERPQQEKSAEDANPAIPRDITSWHAIKRGKEKAIEQSPESPVWDKVDSNKPGNKAPVASLHEAARVGDKAAVQQLLGTETCDIEQRDAEGKTPIQCAAEEGHEPVVRLLLERGAVAYDHRSWKSKSNTLVLAAHKLQDSVVQLLVDWPFPDDLKEFMVVDALSDTFEQRQSSSAFRLLMRATQTLGSKFEGIYSGVLWWAIYSEDKDAISLILNAIKDLETKKSEIRRGLDHAVSNGQPEITRLFLDAGADANSGSGKALWEACLRGSEETVRLLLDRGADPNLGNIDDTPLAQAAKHGDPSLLQLLLKAGANPNRGAVVRNAVKSGSVSVLRLLVEAGADVNVENTCSNSFGMGVFQGDPLDLAAEKGHTDVVRFLLKTGINLDYEFEFEFYLEPPRRRGERALITACQLGHEAIALLLMDAGVNASYMRLLERPPWFRDSASRAVRGAASKGLVTVLQRFLEAAPDDRDWLVGANDLLDLAAENGQREAVLLLLQYGAEIEGGESEKIPLHSAASQGHAEVVLALLDNGADIMSKSPGDGGTALHAAARRGQTTVLQVLLDRGADIDARNEAGESSLHNAAREGHMDAVRVLVGHGASINAKDNDGWSPAHRAAWNKHKEVLELLTTEGADLDMETPEGWTAMDLLEDEDSDTLSSL